jgi:disulfide bond formation protein DsbB
MNRSLDTLALFALSGVLLVAFYYQIVLSELPCPLCALQRVGFIVAGAGLILNLRVGYSPAHYGLALLTAAAAGGASLRQIALHIVPGTGHYGSALFGMHFYTWAFVGYGALVVYVGVMLLLEGHESAGPSRGRIPERAARRLFNEGVPALPPVGSARMLAVRGARGGERGFVPARMRLRPMSGQSRRLPVVAGDQVTRRRV